MKKKGYGYFTWILFFIMLFWCGFLLKLTLYNDSLYSIIPIITNSKLSKDVNVLEIIKPSFKKIITNEINLYKPKNDVIKETINEETHIIFSTDCTFYQDWQTLLVFYSAVIIKQEGSITRIASGCSDEKKIELTNLYKKLYPQYGVHFTPDFKQDSKSKKKYDFYNKPYGVEHWLENASPPISDGVVVILLDPDMILLRKITPYIRGQSNNLYIKRQIISDENIPIKVKKGQPAAQLYGLGAPWTMNGKNFNKTNICGLNSPCLEVKRIFGEDHYSVGPPYLLEKSDLYKLSLSWTDFVPRVYEKYPELLAEMYAYSMAAAHENLPHFTLHSFMISNTDVEDEGWKWIDDLEDKVAEPPIDGIFYPDKPLPNVMHYCQFFRAGELGFQKRRLKKEIFNCDEPLLLEPAIDLGLVRYKNRDGEILKITKKWATRNTFALNVITRSINNMVIHYRNIICENKSTINFNRTKNLAVGRY